MKTVKFLSLISMYLVFGSCSLTVDVDDQDELGRITASVLGDNSDGSVSVGGYLDVEVNVFDRDGIASIQIEIPALNIDVLINSDSYESSQKINQTFSINEVDSNESRIIWVTLTDKDNNRYTKTIAFAVK